MPRKPRPNHLTLHLQGDETDSVRRIVGMFPDGAVSMNRVGRLALRAGLPLIEAQLRQRAEEYVANSRLVVKDDDGEPQP
jgi:hypothetical protein